MSLLAVIDALEAAGVDAAAVIAAVRAHEARRIAEDQARKDKAAAKKRRQRANLSPDVPGTDGDIEGQTGTSGDRAGQQGTPPSPALSPQTPQSHPHPPGNINTRAKTPSIAKPNGFARFWEAYPNKTGKLAAEKAFPRALDKIDHPDPLGVILAGIERARSSREWCEGYVPHPTTWLNQGRWDDQPAEIIPLKPDVRHGQHHPHQAQPSARADRLGRSLAGLMAAVDERTTGVG